MNLPNVDLVLKNNVREHCVNKIFLVYMKNFDFSLNPYLGMIARRYACEDIECVITEYSAVSIYWELKDSFDIY